MGTHEYRPNRQDPANDDLDRILDSALARYTAVEPRTGLEERVLANLRSERMKSPLRAWWHWSAAAALAVVVFIAVMLAVRSLRPAHPAIVHHPSTSVPVSKEPTREATSNVRPHAHPSPKIAHPPSPAVTIAAAPKLDQFPSPLALSEQDRFPSPQPSRAENHFPSLRPMSEQEQNLATYVDQFPEKAALIARAQTALIERVKKEDQETYGPPNDAGPRNSKQFDSPNL